MKSSTLKILSAGVVAVIVAGLAWKYWPSNESITVSGQSAAITPTKPHTIVIHDKEYNLNTTISLKITGEKFHDGVPEILRKFVNLEALDLSDNKIVSLPEWFSEFTKLKELTLANNKIGVSGDLRFESIECLKNMANLEYLDLRNNSLGFHEIESLEKIPKLKYLDVSGNSSIQSTSDFLKLANMKSIKNLIISYPLERKGCWIVDLVSQLRPDHSLETLFIRSFIAKASDREQILNEIKEIKPNLRVIFE